MFCLIPKIAEDFKAKIIKGEIDPIKLADMTSEERHNFFVEHLGGDVNAAEVNALFESKLLLKNQQLGMINWAKQMLGEKNPALRDIISKVEKMDKILDPATKDAFLKDLASKKLGTEVTFEEAKQITELSSKMKTAKEKITPDMPKRSPARLEYGAYKRGLQNYLDDLKLSNKPKETIGSIAKENINPLTASHNIGGFAKGWWSSMDLSVLGRQLIKTLIDSPEIWANAAYNAIKLSVTQLKDGPEINRVMDSTMADIYSRPRALEGRYQKDKLDVGVAEEAHPVTIGEKLPLGLGRLYKASEIGFTATLRLARADLYDKLADIAEKNGMNLDNNIKGDPNMRTNGKGVAIYANSMTGRGYLGTLESSSQFMNDVFFSIRKVKSDIDFITGFRGQDIPDFLKRRAAFNLAKTAISMVGIATLFNSFKPGSVETDPTSTNFLRIKIGDTYHDFLGGMPGLVVLLSRVILSRSKSGAGNVTQLNTGKYGDTTSSDMFWNWLQNKLSPIGSIIKDFANRKDFNGNPVTVPGEIVKLITPLPAGDFQSIAANHNPAELKALSDILNELGFQGYVQNRTKSTHKSFTPAKH